MTTRHIHWFDEYVRSYLSGDPEDDRHIALKKEHSLKVLEEARAMTPELGLPAGTMRAALLAALYHDAGRFPQYRAYKTFKDSLSVDHALLGVRSLKRKGAPAGTLPGPLSEEDPGTRALVLGAVAMHNRRALPPGLSSELATVARIVRDSDKLDIIRIMLDYLRPGGKRSDVVTLHVSDEPDKYTGEIVEQIRRGGIGDYALMRYENDFMLLLLSWVHDLNFRPARRAFLRRGHAEELFGLLPATPELTALQDRIYDILNS